ncbi:MAG TPA: hypothetical protein VK695_04025 [Steroidobacteraceae bacterium]|jgi:hypothetical protein|nr:hypothetical protein [Steroidobacteraceae bacterium]
MLLQCEAPDAERGPSAWPDWLPPDTLRSLAELNESCLALLAEQAVARGASACPLLQAVGELWGALDAAGRARAASVPYLLLDAGFAEPLRWRLAGAPQVGERQPLSPAFFTVAAAREVARWIFTFAWQLARAEGPSARLLLGLQPPAALLIRQYTARQIQGLGENHPEWLRPRWAARVQIWRELLLAAAGGDTPALARARRRGIPLLAAEARLTLSLPAPPS